MSNKQITGFEARPGFWRIKVNGQLHPSDFVSARDIRLWYANMVQHGLYRDHALRIL